MSLPNIQNNVINTRNIIGNSNTQPDNQTRRTPPIRINRFPVANESKNMDEILGTNVTNEYQKFQNQQGIQKRIIRQQQQIENNQPVPQNPINNQKNEQENIYIEQPSYDFKSQSFDVNRNDLGLGNIGRLDEPKAFYKEINRYEQLDLSDKLNGQEKIINLLMNQLNTLDKQFQTELKRTKIQLENERDLRARLEQNLRVTEDQTHMLNDELLNKFSAIENRLNKEERSKIELKEKLQVAEHNQKELMFYIRNLQKQDTTELLQMRGIIQEKITEEQGALIKEREKSKALFQEVVRLGEQQERQAEIINNLNSIIESKLQIYESKFSGGEKSLSMIQQKGDTGLQYLSEWNDKLDKRLLQLESNLYALGREQMKDRDSLNRLDATNARVTQDLKDLLINLQDDYQTRLDTRVTEMVNRLVMEHEERIKQHNDFKYDIEVRERLNQERMNYEREEMRDRYSSIDSIMRAEFKRKDEQILTMQQLLENNIKLLQNALKEEENKREQGEAFFRQEYGKFQEVFMREYESFRSTNGSILEKITETVREEITTRLSSDVDLKNYINTVTGGLVEDLEMLKDNFEKQNQIFASELKEISQESAERDNQLSRYVDDEIKKYNDAITKKYEKLKGIFGKMAEQFRTHLINTENMKKEFVQRMDDIEKSLETTKSDLYNKMNETLQRYEMLLQETKNVLLNEIITRTNVLDDKVKKLDDELTAYVSILKDALKDLRDQFMQRIEKITEKNETFNLTQAKSLEDLMKYIAFVKDFVVEIRDEVYQNAERMEQELNDKANEIDTQLQNEKQLNIQRFQDINQQLETKIKLINSQINDNHKFSQQIDEMLSQTQIQLGKQLNSISFALYELKQGEVILQETIKVLDDKVNEDLKDIYVKLTIQETYNIYENYNMTNLFNDVNTLMEFMDDRTKNTNNNFINYLEQLTNNMQKMEQGMSSVILETVRREINSKFELLKRENQEIWNLSVKYSKTKINELDALNLKNDNLDVRLGQIIGVEDDYQKPVTKKQN